MFTASIGFAREELHEPQATESENVAAHQVFRAMQTVRFEHRCADAEHQVRRAGLGRRTRPSTCAHLREARHGRQEEIVIGARLVAMRIESGSAGVMWSVSLEARTAAGRHIGVRQSHYFCCPARGEGRRRPFRTERGAGVAITEPLEQWVAATLATGLRMETTAARLGLTGERSVAIADSRMAGVPCGFVDPPFDSGSNLGSRTPSKNPDLLASLSPFGREAVQTLAAGRQGHGSTSGSAGAPSRRLAEP